VPQQREQNAAPRMLADPLALLPPQSELVLRVDVTALRRSSLFAKYESQILGFVAPAFAECGYNAISDITTFTAGFAMVKEVDLAVIVVRGIDRAKTLACLKSSKVKARTPVTFDGEFVSVTDKSGHVRVLTFADDRTLVIDDSTTASPESLRAALQIGAPLHSNAVFTALDKKLAKGAAVSAVIMPTSELVKKLTGVDVLSAYGTLDVDDGIRARISIHTSSAEAANALARRARDELDDPDKPGVRVHDATVDIDVRMSAEELAPAIAWARLMRA